MELFGWSCLTHVNEFCTRPRVKGKSYVWSLGFIIGPCPPPLTGTKDYWIGSNFWKFYLIRTHFTLAELVFLVKVFRLFRLEWIFLGVLECEHSR
jgi:hypothetical protein